MILQTDSFSCEVQGGKKMTLEYIWQWARPKCMKFYNSLLMVPL